MTFQIKPLSNNIGAEVIGLNLRNALDEDMVDRVNTEWLAHNILLFRGQKLTRPQNGKYRYMMRLFVLNYYMVLRQYN